jgi:hypothetical protein
VTNWYSSSFGPYTRAINSSGASVAGHNSSCGGIGATRSFTPAVSASAAPSGNLTTGSTLTSQVTFAAQPVSVSTTYSWQRCTSATAPFNCTTISGATNSSYLVTVEDTGFYVRSIAVGSSTVNGVTQSTTGTSELTSLVTGTPDTTAPTLTSFSSTSADGSLMHSAKGTGKGHQG